jgi:hypothetical protein
MTNGVSELEADWSKHGVRFAASCGERYSGVWLAIADGNDFYLGARSVFGTIKISLHQSGECRVAITKQHLKRMLKQGLPPPAARALYVWRRRTDLGVSVPLVVHLIFPTDYLTAERPIGKSNKKVIIYEGSAGSAVEFLFFYSQGHTLTTLGNTLAQIGRPVFRTELDNGQCVSMVARQAHFDPGVLPPSTKVNGRIISGAVTDETSSNVNAFLFTGPADQEPLQVIDIGGVSLRCRN